MINPDRRLDRRIGEDVPLNPEQADGPARLPQVAAHARRVFQDMALAVEGMPNPPLEPAGLTACLPQSGATP